jgi:ubiquinone/menaquinone biosynthesis C-methylase UbiE
MHPNSTFAYRYESWYHKGWGRRFDKFEKKLLLRSLKCNEEKSILEIGCGTGHFTRWFQSLGMKAVGLDISREMLSAARDLSRKSMPLIQGKAELLPFNANTFDIVAMVTTLEFVGSPVEVLSEALRVARNKIIIGMLNIWSPLILYRRIKRNFKKSSYRGAQFYSSKKLRSLIYELAQKKNVRLIQIRDIRENSFLSCITTFFLLEIEKAHH